MIRLILACHLAVFFSGVGGAWGGTLCPNMESQLTAPVSDMGERVFSIGCPNNLQGTLSPGIINGPPRLVNDQPLWQVEMNIYPGSSGSPVFDARGQLVAMIKGRYRGTTTVGFLTPLEAIITFVLNENG